jgi:hypothetical protein
MSDTSSYSSESSSLSSQSSSSQSSSSKSSSSELQARDLPFDIRGIEWKASSLVNSSLCAIDYGLPYKNRVSQSEKMLLDNYSINRVALYLGSRRGSGTSYNVIVEIYETDADGKPFSLIGSATKPAAEFTNEGWYFFDVNILNKAKPEYDMVNVVFYQDGGSDLDCVPWFYGEDLSAGLEFKRICYISSDATAWEEVPQISMTMKLINSIDMFSEAFNDTPPHRITTSPGNPATLKLNGENYLSAGSDISNTKIISSLDPENEDLSGSPYVMINHPNTIASIVIDGSGSMGWNDRRNNRLKLAKSISNLLINTYPGNILVDVIRMGSIQVEELEFDSSRTYATIKIDLFSPDNVVNNADGSTPSISDGVCYYGLKNLEEGHTYIVAGIYAGQSVIEDGKGIIDPSSQTKKPINMSSFGDATEEAEHSIETLGPGHERTGVGQDSLVSKLNGSVNQIRRNIQVKRELAHTGISSVVMTGDLTVQVEDPTVFDILSNVDIFDANISMPNRTITSIDNDLISFENEITSTVGVKTSNLNGVVQESVKGNFLDLSDRTTIDLLIKDELVSRNVTFYLQTPGGGTLEWSIQPFSEWESVILFYSDVGGKLSLQGFDTDGQPLPDATEIQLFVDRENPDFTASVKKVKVTSLLNPPLLPGTNTIELSDVAEIKSGYLLTMLDEDKIQRTSGFIVDTVNEETNTITIFPSYEIESFPVTDIETEPPVKDQSQGGEKVYLPVSVVDLTPLELQRAPNPDILLDYDSPPTDHLNTDRNSYNQDETRERKLPTDFPAMYSLDSKAAYVSLQVLPITEDYVDTESEKNEKIVSATKKTLSDKQRALVESLEEDYRQELESRGQKPPEVTTQPIEDKFTPTVQSKPTDSDYSIETPVLLYGGMANSFMQTFTKEMELLKEEDVFSNVESFDRYGGDSNWKLSGLLGKKYSIFPYVILKDSSGSLLAIKAVKEFDAFFASPYQIWSNIGPTGKSINYECVCEAYSKLTGQIERQFSSVDVPGWYASSDETIDIDYVITEKGNLLQSGELLIKIFDANRSLEQMADPASYTPNLRKEICSVCEPAFDVSLQQMPIYSDRTQDSSATYIESIPLQEVTYLDGYSGQIALPIVNGRCRFSIKAPSKVVAKIIVFAELVFPNDPNKSVVKPDPIWFPSPMSLVYTGQNKYTAGDVSYEIGAKVLYFGQPVTDNVTVEFESYSHKRYLPDQGNVFAAEDPLAIKINEISATISSIPGSDADRVNEIKTGVLAEYGEWPPTQIVPKISKTIGNTGIARDVFIGPHGEVVNHFLSSGEEKGDEENITIKAYYLGFEDTISTKIEWIGSTEKKDFNFKMRLFDDAGNEYLNGETTAYADGWKSMYVLADLAASVDRFSHVDGFIDVLLGKDENGNKVGTGYPAGVVFTGGGGGKNAWSENNIRHPLTGDLMGDRETLFGQPGRGYALSKPISLSAAISQETKECDCVPRACCSPQCTLVNAYTSVNIGDKTYRGSGCAAETQMTCNVPIACDETVIVKEQPVAIRWVEPLNINLTNFGDSGFSILRNGEKIDIVADVTFSGEAIPLVARAHNVTDSSGLPLGMPVVTWDIYKVVKDQDILENIVRTRIVRDQSVTLTSYSSAVSVELTSSFEGLNGTESHFHKCQVDSQGNGKTTATYVTGSGEEVATTHEHQVINYVVQSSTTLEGQLHSHVVRSVASTSINPIFDNTNDICILAKVSYDASKMPVSRTVTFSKCSTIADETTKDAWKLRLLAPREYLVQEATTNDYSGFPVIAEITHIVNNERVEIPDGLRVHFDLEAHITSDGDSVPGSAGRVAVFASDENRKFVSLKWKAAINGNNGVINAEAATQVLSPFSWMPNIRGLVPSPTSDSLYIENALESITTLGASPLHDAAYLSASRVIKHRIDNEDWKDCFASSILITDGDENLSDKTLDQGVSSIKRMSENPSAIAAVTGQPHPSDLFILKRYAEETSGALVNMSGAEVGTDAIARRIFSERLAQANTGVYRNVVDLSDVKLIKAATLNVYIPTGCSVLFRTRFSDDRKDWGPWSQNQTVPLSGEIDISSYSDGQPHRYMEYETTLKGNESFESPRFLSLEGSYIEPKKHLLLFAPISVDISSDEYVGEVLITHKVSESSNSTIQYGVLQAETAEENEYYSKAQPLVGTGTRQILLGRHNELATSNDRRTFWLTNGPWPSVAGIEVYKIIDGSEELVSPDLYSANPRQGTISFASLQEDDAYLSVSLKYPPLIRIACMITNYGETAISIDHIGLMYNTVQRIERDDSGIIRSPISDIYEMSSSSSESSE